MTKITLSDGTAIEFEGINGNNFIVGKKEMDTSVFTNEALKSGTIDTDEGTYEFKNLRFTQQQKQLNGDYYICFHEVSEQQILAEEMEELLVDIAEIEVSAGNLDVEDIPETLQEEVKLKIEDGKRLDK